MPKIKDCKMVKFAPDKNSITVASSVGEIILPIGSLFKIPYLGISLYVWHEEKWIRLNRRIHMKIAKFLRAGGLDDKNDYYRLLL